MAGRANSSGLLSAFGSDSVYASVAGSRIKIWDAASGSLQQQLVDPARIGAEYTCVAAVFLESAKKRKSAVSAAGLPGAGTGGYIALGTHQGTVTVWNVATGDSFQLAAQSSALPIQDLCFNKAGSQLFACAADGSVFHWNVASQSLLHLWKPEAPSGVATFRKICLSPDETQLLLAGNHLLVWSIPTEAVMAEFIGHRSPITSLAVSPDGKFAATGSSERSIHLWNLAAAGSPGSAAGGRKKNRQLIVTHSTITAGQDPVALAFNPYHSQATYHLAAVLRDSVAVWDWAPPTGDAEAGAAKQQSQAATPAGSKKNSSRKRKSPEGGEEAAAAGGRIVSQSAVTLPPLEEDSPAAARAQAKDWKKRQANNSLGPADFLRIHGVRFVSAAALLVVRELASPHFHRAEYKPPASVDILGTLLPAVALPAIAGNAGLLEGSGAKKFQGQSRAPVDVLAAFSGSAAGVSSELASALPGDAEAPEPGRDLASMSLAERLAAFAKQQEAAAAAQKQAAAAGSGGASFVTPSAGSLHNVLSQAIKTNDSMLIEECLSLAHGHRNAQVISRTVQRLSPQHALELVRIIIRRFKRNPARGPQLLPWFRQIFTIHASYLLSMPWLRSELVELSTLMEMRLSSYEQLLRLKGRLDLVLGQVEGLESAANGDVHDDAPRAVYVESEDAVDAGALEGEDDEEMLGASDFEDGDDGDDFD